MTRSDTQSEMQSDAQSKPNEISGLAASLRESSDVTLYCARYVLPVSSDVIEDGAVAVAGTRIVGCDTRASLIKNFPCARLQNFSEAAILPGFVNAHSHLELTIFRGFLEQEENDFSAWLRRLTATRAEHLTPDDIRVSATCGAIEAARAGVTCVGDASDSGMASLAALRDVGLRGIVYQEAFGPDPKSAREQFDKLREKIAALRASETELARVGVSPHAPYTVSAPLLQLIAAYAEAEQLPLMMHAAESVAEDLLMREGRGTFAEGLTRRGIEWHAPGVSTIQYLAALGVLSVRPLLAHCIQVDDADIETLRETGARVAHCPKSNAKLGHGRAPFAKFLERKVIVGLGSDSVASNNACDMLEEARFALLSARAARDASDSAAMMSAADVLSTMTRGGARALGLENQTGTLDVGLEADLTVINLNGAHQLPVFDPAAALVFSSSGRDVLLTMVAGKEIYRDGRVLIVDEERLGARLKEIGKRLRA
ncbi:MAG: amidohydrolase family protein [Pyrinomonadaceae bacterium]